jgi:16S rRNA (guanine(966)-N(2))-methyltransferase RsmD
MRVIAGELKGRRLVAPGGRRTRPTADQVRLALMDSLAPWLPGARFLDLFAGAGGVGIEALSRGAGEAVFVETGAPALRSLRQNLLALNLRHRSRVLQQPAETAIQGLKRARQRFRLIFLDPPYESSLAARTLERLGDGLLLEPSGLVVVQHLTKVSLPGEPGVLHRVRARRFGETTLTFFRSGE